MKRPQEGKPSDNFALRGYRHRRMDWDKSPIEGASCVLQPPDPDWLFDQILDIGDMERRVGYRVTESHRKQARKHWSELCDMELTHFSNMPSARYFGHSPSGTLFPRYLVKGLYELHQGANDRGEKYFEEEYDKAKARRRDAICRWKTRNPDLILADDPLSVFRTWPSDLMIELDSLDREAVRSGNKWYMGVLIETEKKVQVLLTFWRDCRLVTGERTPPSPRWPDPKTKLCGRNWPDYLFERLMAFDREPSNTIKRDKRRLIELTRWKEVELNADSEPAASDTPFPKSLMDELDAVWRYYDFLEPEKTKDKMILRIALEGVKA